MTWRVFKGKDGIVVGSTAVSETVDIKMLDNSTYVGVPRADVTRNWDYCFPWDHPSYTYDAY